MAVSYSRFQHFGPGMQQRYLNRHGQVFASGGLSNPLGAQIHPTHTDAPSPLASGGLAQPITGALSPAGRANRRPLLLALALMRARQDRGGAATDRRLAGFGQGAAATAEGVRGLSQRDYESILRLALQGRPRPTSPRYGSLNPYF